MLITLLTGSTPAQLSAQADAATQKVTLAVEAIIMLQAIVVFELFLIWRKGR
jgi:hypothetical protein